MSAEKIRHLYETADVRQPEPPAPLFRDLPPAEPFPVAALGNILAPAAEGIQAKVQAPAAICAQSVLAAAALAVQGHADVTLPTGHNKPLSLFCVTVAASGERKSAVDAEALWPIRKREASLRDAYGLEVESWQNDQAAWTKARDEALKKGKGDRQAIKTALDTIGPAPAAPLLPILTMNEPNWPGLCRAFDEGLPALGLFSAEGGGFLGGHGMNEENRLRTATGLSEVWDGEAIRRTRGGEGIKIMPGRRLALHLMMQPGVADKLLGDALLVDQGLTARMLVVAPDSLAGTRMWKEVPPEADAAIRRYGARLLAALEAPLPVPPGKRNELEPRALPLSAAARKMWIATADAIEKQIGSGGPLEPVRAFANKAPEHAARIAAVLALVDDINAVEVSADHLAAAVELVGHYTAEALRLKAAGEVNGDLILAQRLVEWLRQWPESRVSLREIYRLGPGPIRDKKTAARIVSILADHGYLIEAGAGEVAGHNRRETWRIWRG